MVDNTNHPQISASGANLLWLLDRRVFADFVDNIVAERDFRTLEAILQCDFINEDCDQQLRYAVLPLLQSDRHAITAVARAWLDKTGGTSQDHLDERLRHAAGNLKAPGRAGIAALLSMGADPERTLTKDGQTAIHAAFAAKNVEALDAMLEHLSTIRPGAVPLEGRRSDLIDLFRTTPMFVDACNAMLDAVARHLDTGADGFRESATRALETTVKRGGFGRASDLNAAQHLSLLARGWAKPSAVRLFWERPVVIKADQVQQGETLSRAQWLGRVSRDSRYEALVCEVLRVVARAGVDFNAPVHPQIIGMDTSGVVQIDHPLALIALDAPLSVVKTLADSGASAASLDPDLLARCRPRVPEVTAFLNAAHARAALSELASPAAGVTPPAER